MNRLLRVNFDVTVNSAVSCSPGWADGAGDLEAFVRSRRDMISSSVPAIDYNIVLMKAKSTAKWAIPTSVSRHA